MNNNFVFKSIDRTSMVRVCSSIALWITGLIVGILLSIKTLSVDRLLVTDFISASPSALGLLVCYIPLLLCIIGILTDSFALNCIILLSESLCRGFCGFLIYILYGNGAWLLRSLVFFSSTLSVILMWEILFRFYIYNKYGFRKNFYMVTVLIFLFIPVERLLISPLLIRLSMYF